MQQLILPILPYVKRLRPAGIVLTALLGAFLAIFILGPTDYTIQGLTVSVSALPARTGITTIDLSPFGSISASTHDTPLAIAIKLKYIGTDAASSIINTEKPAGDTLNLLYAAISEKIKPFIQRQVILAFMGAFALVLILWRTRWWQALLSGLLCSLLLASLFFATGQSYRLEAFKEPEYCGVIALAPQLIPEPGELINKLEEAQANTRKAVASMKALMTSANGLSLLPSSLEEEQYTKVLLISDLHSSPLGFEFIKEIASTFRVNMILDAGDLTDLGTVTEAEFALNINTLGVPYVFCPGNHDTPEIIEFMNTMENARVLNGSTISVGKIKILGSADPMAAGSGVEADNPETMETLLTEQASALITAGSDELLRPDIVVAHNPQAAEKLVGHFPLIVNGHTHQQSIAVKKDSVILNPGTSGAAGLRGLYAETAVPYSAMVLYFNAAGQATAVDTVKYEPFSDRFFIERKLLKKNIEKQQEITEERPLAENYPVD